MKCGTRVLYDEHGELNGMEELDTDARQYDGEKKGTWTYAIVYSDVGQRAATRNQIMVDSTKSIGKVFSENLPDFRVDFSIKPKSDPVDYEVENQ
jgi:hypothetical protein